MKINIKINLDNDAFAGNTSAEVNRILDVCKDRIENIYFSNITLKDINGNIVGNMIMEDE